MVLRIKEVCKAKGITMAHIAQELDISPITLSQSLNGNPTLRRLQEVADVLGVEVVELFEPPVNPSVYGCLYIDGKPHLVNSKDEVLSLMEKVK